jgi:hypothetical protein
MTKKPNFSPGKEEVCGKKKVLTEEMIRTREGLEREVVK